MPKKALRTMNIELRTYNYALCIMNYELTLGVPLRVGLSAISLLASFPLAQKYLQIPQSPFPNPISRSARKGCRFNP